MRDETPAKKGGQYFTVARVATLLLLLATFTWTTAACGTGEDEEAVVIEVASNWVDSNVSVISETVADLVLDDEPALASLVAGGLAGLIRENISWTYSGPVRLRENRYRVTATAVADATIKIPLLDDRRYVATVPFNLEVDTNARNVVSWLPDLGSASVESKGGS